MNKRRVAVTGLGIVCGPGIGTDDFWAGLKMPPIAGEHHEIENWDAEKWMPKKEARRVDRFAQMALVAAEEALAQAGELTATQDRVAVPVASGIGGLEALEELVEVAYSQERRPSPLLIPMMMCNAAAAAISIKHGFGGPITTQVVACAAGGQAIIDGMRAIQWGYADVAIAGGAEAAIRTPSIAGFVSARAMSPTLTARPFSADRDGMVLGEGAAILVLEEWEMALARGATILAEMTGGAATGDAHHLTAPHPAGVGAERAVRLAIADAGLEPGDIGYVNAHGTGTELNDGTEGAVIGRVFIEQPPVSSIKGATGHALGASGAIEAVTAVLAIRKRELPPNLGLTTQDPKIPLTDIVLEPRPFTPAPVVSNSFGFGGHNTVLVISPPPS
ncbi:MAG: beta-ketoacyl-[acyl-carrier-protein] synthase family protein [Actinobacteria bacterium]|nr:beta-ketoacyl-[acyl-carrier-protein] synthase family protein [Actinomycetota bacterium]